MAIPKICGIETEYAIIQPKLSEQNPIHASSVLVNAYAKQADSSTNSQWLTVLVRLSVCSSIGNAGSSIAYSNSKAAIISQTRCLARALAPEIRVNAVAPGLTRTAWTDPWNDEGKQVSIEASLLKRMVEPEDIAQGMLFLVVNPAITGQTIVIDNGRLPT